MIGITVTRKSPNRVSEAVLNRSNQPEVFTSLRTYAIWQGNRWILAVTFILGLLPHATNIVGTIALTPAYCANCI